MSAQTRQTRLCGGAVDTEFRDKLSGLALLLWDTQAPETAEEWRSLALEARRRDLLPKRGDDE